MAEPNRDDLIFDESDVKPPGGLKNKVGSYDLELFGVDGTNAKGVLIVTVKVQMKFHDGESQLAATKGQTLEWGENERQDFADEVQSLWQGLWSRKHVLKTQDAAMTEIEVVFETPITVDGISVSEHWELDVVRIDRDRSATRTSSISNNKGRGDFDSRDVIFKSGMSQRGAVHELGHMIGLRDEYTNSAGNPEDNPNFLSDVDSVMNEGEIVRDRHYAMFAHWASKMWTRQLIKFTSKSVLYKVNGTTDLKNAQL